MTVIGGDPVIMLEAPLPATQARALEKAGMKIDDIDLYEVNEAFASVSGLPGCRKSAPIRRSSTSMAVPSPSANPLGASGNQADGDPGACAPGPRAKRWGLQTMCEGRRPRQT